MRQNVLEWGASKDALPRFYGLVCGGCPLVSTAHLGEEEFCFLGVGFALEDKQGVKEWERRDTLLLRSLQFPTIQIT